MNTKIQEVTRSLPVFHLSTRSVLLTGVGPISIVWAVIQQWDARTGEPCV